MEREFCVIHSANPSLMLQEKELSDNVCGVLGNKGGLKVQEDCSLIPSLIPSCTHFSNVTHTHLESKITQSGEAGRDTLRSRRTGHTET